MNSILSLLRSPEHKELIVEVRNILLFFICLILLVTVDNLIADRASENWHPTLGIVFGVCTVACLGGLIGFPSLKKNKNNGCNRHEKNTMDLWESAYNYRINSCATPRFNRINKCFAVKYC